MATLIIDQLITTLGFRPDPSSGPAVDSFNSKVDAVAKTAMAVSATIVSAASSILFFATKANSSTDALRTMSATSGIAADDLQKFALAAERAGGNADAMKAQLVKLNADLWNPTPGAVNPMLLRYGLYKKDAQTAMLEIAQILSSEPNANKRGGLAAAMGIGPDLQIFLQQGVPALKKAFAEISSSPSLIDQKTLDGAREFNAKMSELRQTVRYFAQTAAAVAGPAVTKLTEQFSAWVRENKTLIEQRFEQVLLGIIKGVGEFARDLGKLLENLGKVAAFMIRAFGSETQTGVDGTKKQMSQLEVVAKATEWALKAVVASLGILAASKIIGIITQLGAAGKAVITFGAFLLGLPGKAAGVVLFIIEKFALLKLYVLAAAADLSAGFSALWASMSAGAAPFLAAAGPVIALLAAVAGLVALIYYKHDEMLEGAKISWNWIAGKIDSVLEKLHKAKMAVKEFFGASKEELAESEKRNPGWEMRRFNVPGAMSRSDFATAAQPPRVLSNVRNSKTSNVVNVTNNFPTALGSEAQAREAAKTFNQGTQSTFRDLFLSGKTGNPAG